MAYGRAVRASVVGRPHACARPKENSTSGASLRVRGRGQPYAWPRACGLGGWPKMRFSRISSSGIASTGHPWDRNGWVTSFGWLTLSRSPTGSRARRKRSFRRTSWHCAWPARTAIRSSVGSGECCTACREGRRRRWKPQRPGDPGAAWCLHPQESGGVPRGPTPEQNTLVGRQPNVRLSHRPHEGCRPSAVPTPPGRRTQRPSTHPRPHPARNAGRPAP